MYITQHPVISGPIALINPIAHTLTQSITLLQFNSILTTKQLTDFDANQQFN